MNVFSFKPNEEQKLSNVFPIDRNYEEETAI